MNKSNMNLKCMYILQGNYIIRVIFSVSCYMYYSSIAVRVTVLIFPITVATPKSPIAMERSSFRKMLLGFKSLQGREGITVSLKGLQFLGSLIMCIWIRLQGFELRSNVEFEVWLNSLPVYHLLFVDIVQRLHHLSQPLVQDLRL